MYIQKSDTYATAYVEILEIIKHMEQKYRDKIPTRLITFFEKNKDSNYKFEFNNIDENANEIFSQKTIDLLAMLQLKYLATESEKEILNKLLEDNDKKFQAELREKYSSDNLFINKQINIKTEEKENDVSVVPYKESFFKKLKKWFKNIFNS